MFVWFSHIKLVQMMILYQSHRKIFCNSRWRLAAILDSWISDMWLRDSSDASNSNNCWVRNTFPVTERNLPSTILSSWLKRHSVSDQFFAIATASSEGGNDWVSTRVTQMRRKVLVSEESLETPVRLYEAFVGPWWREQYVKLKRMYLLIIM